MHTNCSKSFSNLIRRIAAKSPAPDWDWRSAKRWWKRIKETSAFTTSTSVALFGSSCRPMPSAGRLSCHALRAELHLAANIRADGKLADHLRLKRPMRGRFETEGINAGGHAHAACSQL